MSTLPPLYGHEAARASLAQAVLGNELPGSILIHGPAGVGKQRLGLWLAQLIVCQAPTGDGPCNTCTACKLTLRLEHPDVHWFFPLPRPKGVSGDKLVDALEDARAAELEARRSDPVHVATPGEPVGIFLAQVQTIRRIANARPAMGDRKAFVIGGAEHMVPQESSPEAANALLKVLEEPPPGTTLILTTSDPDALLDTIRSRLLPIRLRPLPEDTVVDFLERYRGIPTEQAQKAARLSEGSIGRALAFLPSDDGPGPLEALRQEARAFLSAAVAPSPLRRLAAAHALAPSGARGTFIDTLDFLGLWLRDLAAVAAGAESVIVNVDATDFLRDLARRFPGAATTVPDAIRAIDHARALAYGNMNPQLILAHLLADLNRHLTGTH